MARTNRRPYDYNRAPRPRKELENRIFIATYALTHTPEETQAMAELFGVIWPIVETSALNLAGAAIKARQEA